MAQGGSVTNSPNLLSVSSSKLRAQPLAEGVAFRVKSQPLALAPINLDFSRFSFTAPGKAPAPRTQTVERGFSFTPSGNSKGVSVGVTARAVQPTRPADQGVAPSASDVDVTVAYRGFALSGGISRADTGLGGEELSGIDLGLSYGGRNWRTSISASAERALSPLSRSASDFSERYGIEAGGSLALSPQLSVGGSLRFRKAPENPTPLDPNKDDRTLMLGGALAF